MSKSPLVHEMQFQFPGGELHNKGCTCVRCVEQVVVARRLLQGQKPAKKCLIEQINETLRMLLIYGKN